MQSVRFHIHKILVIVIFAVITHAMSAATPSDGSWVLKGIVRDSVSLTPIEAVSVIAEGGRSGTLTRPDGTFVLKVPEGAKYLSVSSLGYHKKIVPLKRNSYNLEVIHLSPSDYMMQEVVVKRRKEKYSKKNNPAVDFARHIREAGKLTDPVARHPFYGYDKYEISTIALNDFKSPEEDSVKFRKYPFLWENVDTSEVSGKPVLTFSVNEKASQVQHRGGSRKELTTGRRHEGLDDLIDPELLNTFLGETMKEIDLYQADIDLLYNRFVSPLSPLAPDFYKFYLTDTVEVDDERCVVLTFAPRNTAVFGFVGQLFVPEADSTMFVKRVSMRLPRDINLNYIDKLFISQDFRKADDGSRLKTKDDLVLELSLIPGTQGLYARRNTTYSSHTFDEPHDNQAFSFLGAETSESQAESRDSVFWSDKRPSALSAGEGNVSSLRRGLGGIPFFRYGTMVIKTLSDGYLHTASGGKSKFDIGPLNTMMSHNYLEGWRFRAGGMTTANLSKRWFGRGYAAWGTKDHKWMYGGEVEYSFIDKKYHSREFPIRSLRLSHKYDINQLGQHYLFTNPDNIFVSWQRMKDVLIDYRRHTALEWKMEWNNNLSFVATLSHSRHEATPDVPFVDGTGQRFGHFSQAGFTVELRFAPGEKFYQWATMRLPAKLEAPVFHISHTVSPRGAFGNMFTVNRTELYIQKRFFFSAWGYLDGILKGAHVWSRVPYTDLLIPNANLSYTIQPESFALMNPMEFINDSSVQWDLTYWANGAILNYIPLIKKLRLREAFAFRGVWGRLSRKNDPRYSDEVFRFPATALATPMGDTPYMEAAVGLDNIFRCLRVDYVWRLTYRNTPGTDRDGVRIAFHMTF